MKNATRTISPETFSLLAICSCLVEVAFAPVEDPVRLRYLLSSLRNELPATMEKLLSKQTTSATHQATVRDTAISQVLSAVKVLRDAGMVSDDLGAAIDFLEDHQHVGS